MATPKKLNPKKSGVKPTLLTHPETGETMTRVEWADKLGITLNALHRQIWRDERGLSRRKWWQGEHKIGGIPAPRLFLGREYEHRSNGLRCWLEWFTPDEDVARGKVRKVQIRVCGNDPHCAQTMRYDLFREEFRLVGEPRENMKKHTPERMNAIVERRNRFRKTPPLIPVAHAAEFVERRTRKRPSAAPRILGEIASKKVY